MNNNKQFQASYRTNNPERFQLLMAPHTLDSLIPDDHPARNVWEFVNKMDTNPCFKQIKSLIDKPGRPATNPKILLALWLYSIIDGNVSGRRIAELCKYHDVYRWIAGGVNINRDLINQFRSADPLKFDKLLTSCLAVMANEKLIHEETISQDGTRIKASAGKGQSYREKKLQFLKQSAEAYLERLYEEKVKNPKAYNNRIENNKLRIAQKRVEKTEKAIEALNDFKDRMVENRKRRRKGTPSEDELSQIRASTTDPAAKVMKMGDGGYRMAYNVQFATGTKSKVIYGVLADNREDPGKVLPLMMQVHNRLNDIKKIPPPLWIADSAYSGKDDIEAASLAFPNCQFFAPPRTESASVIRKNDSEAVRNWKKSLESAELRQTYKERASTSEFANAQVKNKGFREFMLRGLQKITGEALLHAIAHNIQRYKDLLRMEKGEVYV